MSMDTFEFDVVINYTLVWIINQLEYDKLHLYFRSALIGRTRIFPHCG